MPRMKMIMRLIQEVLLVLLLIFLLLTIEGRSHKVNVALHAQVAPFSGNIVGSVITTDGMRSALRRRNEIGHVEIFYPFSYDGIFRRQWDLVIIEGWFMMIHEFIQLLRSHSPHVTILYFCLDPIFPGMDGLITFDVDGYLTNSISMRDRLFKLTGTPSEFVLLAADPEKMTNTGNTSYQTNNSEPGNNRDGIVYVGAGGEMLQYKPKLLEMLLSAVAGGPSGLRLYGSGWDRVADERIRAAWLGTLPKDALASTYAGAQIVLASTIEAQSDAGMVNNRVFEALSCGAIVISDYSPALAELAGDIVLLVNKTGDASRHIDYVMSNPNWARVRSTRGREFVVSRHTWGHRVVEVLDFFYELRRRQSFSHSLPMPLPTSTTMSSVDDASPTVLLDTCTLFSGGGSSSSQTSNIDILIILKKIAIAVVPCRRRQKCPPMAIILSDHLTDHSDVTFVVHSVVIASLVDRYEILLFSESRWRDLVDASSSASGSSASCSFGDDKDVDNAAANAAADAHIQTETARTGTETTAENDAKLTTSTATATATNEAESSSSSSSSSISPFHTYSSVTFTSTLTSTEEVQRWRWLSVFDVLLAVVTPFDSLDMLMQSSSIPTAASLFMSKDRIQRRAVYLLGFDGSLLPPLPPLPSHQHPQQPHNKNIDEEEGVREKSGSSASEGESSTTTDTPTAAGGDDNNHHTHHIHHNHQQQQQQQKKGQRYGPSYELIWFRDYYEIECMRKAGWFFDDFRLVHAFGVGARTSHVADTLLWGVHNDLKKSRHKFDFSWGKKLSPLADDSSQGSEDGSQPESDSSQQQQQQQQRGVVVVVCFWTHIDQCTQAALYGTLTPAAARENTNYTLLLIGGTWSGWLDYQHHHGSSYHDSSSSSSSSSTSSSSGTSSSSSSSSSISSSSSSELLVSVHPVHRTVHVADGRLGDAVNIVQQADRIVIMHNDAVASLSSSPGAAAAVLAAAVTVDTPSDGTSRSASSSSKGGEDTDITTVRGINTVNDVIWPLVAFTVRDDPNESIDPSSSSPPPPPARMVHLSNANSHLLSVLNSGCDQWSEAHARTSAVAGIVRMHGFPVAAARVDALRVTLSEAGDLYKYDELYDGLEGVHREGVAYQLTFWDFLPGRDGACCVKYKGVSLTCMIRPHSYLIIALNDTRIADEEGGYCNSTTTSTGTSTGTTTAGLPATDQDHDDNDQEELSFSLILRGNMFADEVFEVPLAIRTSRRAACTSNGAKLDDGSRQSFLRDSFHVTIDVN